MILEHFRGCWEFFLFAGATGFFLMSLILFPIR
jgi:hypothetical protein